MKKFLVRAERALIHVLVAPSLRPAEHDIAVALARSIAVRVGLSSAVVAIVLELIDRVIS